MTGLSVKAAERSYPIVIDRGLDDRLHTLIRKAVGDNRLFVFFDANFYALHGGRVRAAAGMPARQLVEMVIPSGEKSKSAAVLASLYDFLLDQKATRMDVLLACGGGVTTDLVGYAAATILRGIRWGAVPTTLLGMVDASIGGKTGINHPRGKNLIGAFWPPEFVCADLEYLTTLERRQMVAGLGEILKCAGLSGSSFTGQVEGFLESGDLYHFEELGPLVRQAAGYKAAIVSRDEREQGPRMYLNLGHTFAHGIEQALGYGRLLHGETVVLGLCAALLLGEAQGYNSKSLSRYSRIVQRFMRLLPRRKLNVDTVLQTMGLDKKRSSQGLRFVLLERLGKPIIYDNVDRRLIKSALESMISIYRAEGGKDA